MNRTGPGALSKSLGEGMGNHRLCVGLYDDRPVPVRLSIGTLPFDQGCRDEADSARSAWQSFELRPHLRWYTAGRTYPRPVDPGGGSHLRHGPGFPRCGPPSRVTFGGCLCHGSMHGRHWRPCDRVRRIPSPVNFSRTSPSSLFQNSRIVQDAGAFYQLDVLAGDHFLHALQDPQAGAAMRHLDQPALSGQAVLRYVGPCRHFSTPGFSPQALSAAPSSRSLLISMPHATQCGMSGHHAEKSACLENISAAPTVTLIVSKFRAWIFEAMDYVASTGGNHGHGKMIAQSLKEQWNRAGGYAHDDQFQLL